jgi:predicted unusual protein kinase regulating ubiquinone biosynthesis (AarF/ABC1/UbiB family)
MAKPKEDDGIPTGRIGRAVPLAGMAARTAGESVLARLKIRDDSSAEEYASRADRYVELLGHSKGALMKAGQIMSFVSFSSTVPEESRAVYQSAMSRLQTSAPPMAPELAAEVIRRELGGSPDQLFSEFNPEPLAAASIGQVHAARLHDGTEVAVKVQYPGVAAAIEADLKNTELLAVMFQLLRSFIPGLTRTDPRSIAAEISERIKEEVDYVQEAKNQTFFANAYRGHPFIRVPQVFPEFSTRRVLTQELESGIRWHEALQAENDKRDTWAEVIYRFVFGGIRKLHAFNADPHPGNYLFRDDGSVSFLDFGCVKYFSGQNITHFTSIIRAILGNDPDSLLKAFHQVGVFNAEKSPTADEVLNWYRGPFELFHNPQPFTVTPEWLAGMIETQYSPTGSSGKVVRNLETPGEFVFLSRIDIGVMSILAELRATNDWMALGEEMDLGAQPKGPLGKADVAFWAERVTAERS